MSEWTKRKVIFVGLIHTASGWHPATQSPVGDIVPVGLAPKICYYQGGVGAGLPAGA